MYGGDIFVHRSELERNPFMNRPELEAMNGLNTNQVGRGSLGFVFDVGVVLYRSPAQQDLEEPLP